MAEDEAVGDAAIARRKQVGRKPVNRGVGVFANIMPIMFLAVAALVLNVLMSRLIDQQRTIIGTLKAIGYSNPQLFLHYTLFGGLIGLLGGLVFLL